MVARTALKQAQQSALGKYGDLDLENISREPLALAEAGFRAYLKEYPKGQYAASVRGLLRRVAWFARDPARLAEEFAQAFALDPAMRNVSLFELIEEADPTARGHLIDQGGGPPRLREVDIWIVHRAHTLNWPPQIYARILGHLRRWRARGVPVVGIQIDFDARTRRLGEYGDFLRDLRQRLPKDCKLSITGLLDWSSQGDSRALSGLGEIVDEVVLQTYQGRKTIPGYAAYLGSLERLTIPFKIGLVQDGEWSPPPSLAANPNFRGYVVFLLNGIVN